MSESYYPRPGIEQRLHALIEASSDVLYRMSPDWGEMRQLEGGGFLPNTSDTNRAWLMDYIPDDDQVTVTAAINEAIRTKSVFSLEHRVRRVDGSIGWTMSRAVPILDDAGEIVEWAGAASDITARREAEEELRELNLTLESRVRERSAALRLYENIVQSDTSAVVAFDTEMRVIAFNKAHVEEWGRLFGSETRVGDVLPDRFPAEQGETLRLLMRRALAGEVFTMREAFGDARAAQPIWDITYNPLRDEHGRIVGAFHRAVDVSARLGIEAELEEAQEVARQSQKMEAVGQLTGGIAHDFNNLLTVIRGSVDLLRRDSLTPERRMRYIEAIGDTADRAARLTSQLLAFARRQTLKPELLRVEDRVSSILEMLKTVVGSHVSIEVRTLGSPCVVRVDPSQFETALVNMTANARDAMNGAGTLTITLDCGQAMPAIRGHGGAPGPFVTIRLHDTGAGIPAGDLPHIFEPFFTTKEVGKGTGLGLSQVFGFAKQSGGDVHVASKAGEGTTFTLYLPQAGQDAAPAAVSQEGRDTVEGQGLCVLLVEDNLDVGRFSTQALEDLGYRTVWVPSAEEALSQLGPDGNGFDVIFSDVVMPGIGGIELAKHVAQALPNIPIVLTSGYSHVLALEGSHGFPLLQKPYSAQDLALALRSAIEKRAAG